MLFHWAEHCDLVHDLKHGQQIILDYVALQKRTWFQKVERGKQAFNIGVLNEAFLQRVTDLYWMKHNVVVSDKVSSSPW